MTTLDLGRATVTGAGDADTFFFAPKSPGLAHFHLLEAGPVSFLQLTGTWGLSSAELDALRASLAQTLERDAASLRLLPMNESVDRAALILRDGDKESILGQSKSSGVPPFHAAFNVMLQDRQLAAVKEAIEGKTQRLVLRYDITRREPVVTTTSAQTSETKECEGEEFRTFAARNESFEKRTTTEQTTTFSVDLDAADWANARPGAPTTDRRV